MKYKAYSDIIFSSLAVATVAAAAAAAIIDEEEQLTQWSSLQQLLQ